MPPVCGLFTLYKKSEVFATGVTIVKVRVVMSSRGLGCQVVSKKSYTGVSEAMYRLIKGCHEPMKFRALYPDLEDKYGIQLPVEHEDTWLNPSVDVETLVAVSFPPQYEPFTNVVHYTDGEFAGMCRLFETRSMNSRMRDAVGRWKSYNRKWKFSKITDAGGLLKRRTHSEATNMLRTMPSAHKVIFSRHVQLNRLRKFFARWNWNRTYRPIGHFTATTVCTHPTVRRSMWSRYQTVLYTIETNMLIPVGCTQTHTWTGCKEANVTFRRDIQVGELYSVIFLEDQPLTGGPMQPPALRDESDVPERPKPKTRRGGAKKKKKKPEEAASAGESSSSMPPLPIVDEDEELVLEANEASVVVQNLSELAISVDAALNDGDDAASVVQSSLASALACVVCFERPRERAAIPCGHKCFCSVCADRFACPGAKCPMCRADIMLVCEIFG